MSKTLRIRRLAIATLRTRAFQAVRGEFLVEFLTEERNVARVWNRARKCWIKRTVDVAQYLDNGELDSGEILTWRCATPEEAAARGFVLQAADVLS